MPEIQVIKQLLPSVYLLQSPHSRDCRGDFVKIYHQRSLYDNHIDFTPAESFLTRSKAGVLRGMHFQVGQAAHDKLVTCIKGHVLDVVVDVRKDSKHFNRPVSIELSGDSNNSLLIGKGYAHGFYSYMEDSWMLYSTSTLHSPEADRGVLWSSIDYQWPCINPTISERDLSHPSI